MTFLICKTSVPIFSWFREMKFNGLNALGILF